MLMVRYVVLVPLMGAMLAVLVLPVETMLVVPVPSVGATLMVLVPQTVRTMLAAVVLVPTAVAAPSGMEPEAGIRGQEAVPVPVSETAVGAWKSFVVQVEADDVYVRIERLSASWLGFRQRPCRIARRAAGMSHNGDSDPKSEANDRVR